MALRILPTSGTVLWVGNDYILTKTLTALEQDSGQPVLCKLPPLSVITVAAIVSGSCFVHVFCAGKLYELYADDLEQWCQPRSRSGESDETGDDALAA